MSTSKPVWPDPASMPFSLFGAPAPAPASAQPLTQTLAGGMDLIKKFWGNLPGGASVPGFLVPTVDVGELDKRISDLRAAESWLEVNLNMLRATIQGLEVQRNTIAAIHSLSAMADQAMSGKAGTPAPAPVPGAALPTGWPMMPPAPEPAPVAAAPAPAPVEPPAEPPPVPNLAPSPAPEPVGAGQPPVAPMHSGPAASSWLGFMQDQFAKVAQAALATPGGDAAAALPARSAAGKTTAKTPAPKKAVAKKSRRRAASPRKSAGA